MTDSGLLPPLPRGLRRVIVWLVALAGSNCDPVYSGGAIHPIEGGRSEDLVFLRSEDPDSQTSFASQRSPGFQTGTAFQAPFSAVLGIHRSF